MFAQDSVMDVQRQAFQEWYIANHHDGDIHPNQQLLEWSEKGGFYFASSVEDLWEAWQATKSQAVPRWISTSDRMPKEGEEVLVHNLGQVRQVTRDSKWAGGFKERNCYGWQAAYGQSHWMPKSIELPEQYHFYYENDAKQKAMIEAQEPTND